MPAKTFHVYSNTNQAVCDAYELLAANIYTNKYHKKLKTIAITSCNPEEGKTTLAISLGLAMANSGWKVLLIDADMRKPAAAKRLYEGSQLGLSDYLSGEKELHEVISPTNAENLSYLSSGRDHANPIALLSSVRFDKLIERVYSSYNFVLFDTPSLSSVVDGALVASKSDTVLLVAKMGVTKMPNLKRAKEQLKNLNVDILGVVLNKVNRRDYVKYFGSYNYFFNSQRFFNNKKAKKIKRFESTNNRTLNT